MFEIILNSSFKNCIISRSPFPELLMIKLVKINIKKYERSIYVPDFLYNSNIQNDSFKSFLMPNKNCIELFDKKKKVEKCLKVLNYDISFYQMILQDLDFTNSFLIQDLIEKDEINLFYSDKEIFDHNTIKFDKGLLTNKFNLYDNEFINKQHEKIYFKLNENLNTQLEQYYQYSRNFNFNLMSYQQNEKDLAHLTSIKKIILLFSNLIKLNYLKNS